MHLDDFVPYRLNIIAELMSRRVMPVYRDSEGMTRPEWRVLAHLARLGTATAKELGTASAMHKTKVSRALQDLETRRWIKRTKSEDDRRFNQVAITPVGRKAHDTIFPQMVARSDEILADLAPEERRTVELALTAFERVLDAPSLR
ncbi:MarR family winged helix-turn-helix transcriptional regulator [Aurantimonas sp. VKM B-3413]|uniref:MarR family winged helix-turn-helix transcriptional regulator n=1 Tax=Aurantimonas sp. VKM B-3413 TaxID=2779401 RepID=UPI001E41CE6C|nr:MarR family winged helix-turn-helix transcriptional regulator [Aurantimonas sp. VKM B-3413]MCB8836266.1 MarR family winged helix-turn-helix transcriptional regulator [Aurantimonas sp. VKM B-3413]